MLDSPRIVECLDVVDDGRQQVSHSSGHAQKGLKAG